MGHEALVDFLCRRGAATERALESGETPLFVAACKGHMEVVKSLYSIKAFPLQANHCGLTPLGTAAVNGHVAVATFLGQECFDRCCGPREKAQKMSRMIKTHMLTVMGAHAMGQNATRIQAELDRHLAVSFEAEEDSNSEVVLRRFIEFARSQSTLPSK